jgi:hypothetical protein
MRSRTVLMAAIESRDLTETSGLSPRELPDPRHRLDFRGGADRLSLRLGRLKIRAALENGVDHGG